MDDEFAVKVLVAVVLGVDSNGGIAKHGLETRRRYDDAFVRPLYRVGERRQRPEFVPSLGIFWVAFMSLDLQESTASKFDVVNLDVGNRRFESARPISETVRAVQQTLLVEAVKSLYDSLTEHVVHRETLTRPVDAAPQRPKLRRDLVPVLGLPLPDLLDEGLPSKIVPRLPFVFQHHLLNDGLRGDTGMVRS